jgi:hypothetical protein
VRAAARQRRQCQRQKGTARRSRRSLGTAHVQRLTPR